MRHSQSINNHRQMTLSSLVLSLTTLFWLSSSSFFATPVQATEDCGLDDNTAPDPNAFTIEDYRLARQACTDVCNANNYCCNQGVGGCATLPCNEGCHVAFFSDDVADCEARCDALNAGGDCTIVHDRHKDILQAGFNDQAGVDVCRGSNECGCPTDDSFGLDCGAAACRAGCAYASQVNATTNEDGDNYLLFRGSDAPVLVDDVKNVSHIPCGSVIPVILLAGQSNMEGNSHEAGEAWSTDNGDAPGQTIQSLASILADDTYATDTDLRDALVTEILKAEESETARATVLADALVALQSDYPALNWTDALTNAACCTFTAPNIDPEVDDNPRTVGPEQLCGSPFGPELGLAHMLHQERLMEDTNDNMYKDWIEFAVAKVAVGGTQLRADWSAAHNGQYWTSLASQIQNPDAAHPACATGRATCAWAAFVWFQGENDSFDQTNADNYLADLTQFIADVRAALARSGRVLAHNDDVNQIPVVIVRLGRWVETLEFGNLVFQAQAMFVENQQDAGAATYSMETNDLSDFYHFDAASFLVIGRRLGELLHEVLPAELAVAEGSDNGGGGSCGLLCRVCGLST